jgi:hypothetical protein
MGTEPVATGTLDRSDVLEAPAWFTITLDTPYTNETDSSVYLVFEMELLTSGNGGWNNYSFSNLSSYNEGHLIYWMGNNYEISPGKDLTFRILDTPPAPPAPNELSAPEVEISFTPAAPDRSASVDVLIRDSVEGFDYTLYLTEDLLLPKENWDILGPSESGYGGVLNWGLSAIELPDQMFFYIKIDPN